MIVRSTFAAALIALTASATAVQAGFTMSGTRTSVNASLDRISLFMTNTGGNSGTNIVALQLGGYGIPAIPGGAADTRWTAASTGVPTPFMSITSTTTSGIRLNATASNNFLVDHTPKPFSTGAGIVSKTDWGMAWTTLLPAGSLNNGSNYQVASLLVDKGAGMHFDVRTGGTTGPAFGLSYDVPAVSSLLGPDITGTGAASVGTAGNNSYFISAAGTGVGLLSAGDDATESAESFSFAALSSPTVSLTLAGDLQKAGSDGAVITPENNGLRVSFNSPKPNQVYNLSFRATDLLTGLSNVETLTLTTVVGVAPEPASLAAIASAGLLMARRRRA